MASTALLAACAPGWAACPIAGMAKYLGFQVGPARGQASWSAPFRKFKERCHIWGSLGAGMFLTMKAFQVYIATVLLFVAQLEPLPSAYAALEAFACQALFPGPMHWTSPDLMKDLQRFGLPWQLRDVRAAALRLKVGLFASRLWALSIS